MSAILLAFLLVPGVRAEEPAAPPPPEPLTMNRTLEDGTVQGFELRLGEDGAVLGFSIEQRPAGEDSTATGAILFAIPADSGIPKTLHLRLDSNEGGNFDKVIAKAIAKKSFPAVLAEGSTITLQFLRGRKGIAIGTPLSTVYGTPPPEVPAAPSRGKSGCRAGECFEERFAACKTAALESKAQIDLAYRYDILGPVEDGCRVRSTFLLHPNESWAGKSMICIYDAEKPFAESIQQPLSCTGELAEAMLSGSQ